MNTMLRRLAGVGLTSAGLCTLAISATLMSPANGQVQAKQIGSPAGSGPNADGIRCAALMGKDISGARIEAADMVTKDAVAGSSFTGPVKAPLDLCRIRAVVSPSSTSLIRMEIWLPLNWNGKLFATGGGGLNGGLGSSLGEMSVSVARGYAGLLNDIGHDISGGTQWGLDPEKVMDFGHRADHVATLASKGIIAAFYGRPATRSYFHGCSGGGREALMLAQRYPADYDGIIAGAPAANFSGLLSAGMWNSQRIYRTPEAATFPAKLKLLRSAVSRKCDKLDGVGDGVVDNPLACTFDPAELECRPGADTATCLSKAEVGIAREIYRGPHLANGKRVLAGYPVGSEADFANPGLGWGPFITENGIGAKLLGTEYFRWLVHKDPDWQAKSYLLDRDYAAAVSQTSSIIDAINPDLRHFVRRGGKLLIYHGWEDAAIPAGATLDYYAAMRRRTGTGARNNVRLFMLPGVAHCAGGPGPGVFDKIDLIDRWVEGGTAPNQLLAYKYENDMLAMSGQPSKLVRSRPVCAWPRIARYKGTGTTNDAANFACRLPEAHPMPSRGS